jgi:hypothetical protein
MSQKPLIAERPVPVFDAFTAPRASVAEVQAALDAAFPEEAEGTAEELEGKQATISGKSESRR